MPLSASTEPVGALLPLGAVAVGVVVALVLAAVVSAVVRSLARRHALALPLLKRARRPMRVALVVVGIWVALRLSTDQSPWRVTTEHALLVALVCAVAWLLAALAFVAEDAALARYRVDVPDNRHARRVRTQITVLRRLVIALVVLFAIAGILMTFPGARTAGASLFASAGVLSVIAGLAAQSTLGNVFAGLQLAFTDAIRVEDVVVVEGEWGRIEEITMTYVVVHLWDDRRLILPSTYFTTTPFQNWTRRAAELLGTVELDLDWSVPVDAMRRELTRALGSTDLWDGRVGILQVTEATGGYVRVRALASAQDAPTLFDLRCYLREELVDWLQRTQPHALPRTRLEGRLDGVPGDVGGETAAGDGAVDRADDAADAGAADVADDGARRGRDAGTASPATAPVRRSAREATRGHPADAGERTQRIGRTDDSRLFTSPQGAERGHRFAGPGQDVLDERERTAGQDAPPSPDPVRDAERPGRRGRVPREDGGGEAGDGS